MNRSRLEIGTYQLHLKLCNFLEQSQLEFFKQKMYHVIEHKYETKKENLKQKCQKLFSERKNGEKNNKFDKNRKIS